MNNTILLVGTGPMAIEYTKVLTHMKKNIVVVGRSKNSADNFFETTGIPAFVGGIEKWLSEHKDFPAKAIVAVTENELGNVTKLLLKNRFSSILVEKPGGFDFIDIKEVAKEASKRNAEVFVAYNRRLYASVLEVEKLIKEDGGILSFNFEFTEWSHVIASLKKAFGVKEKWFLHNSTHVIDLAFFLGGKPEKISTYQTGKLTWHPSAACFAGAGITTSGAIFSYQANWISPGRWGLELMTKKHRFILRPLEKLKVQEIGNTEINDYPINDMLDQKFKPGLYREIESFLTDEKKLCTIKDQYDNIRQYKKMVNY